MKANMESQREVGLAPASGTGTNWYVKRPHNDVLYKVSVLSDGTIVMDDGVSQIVHPPAKRRGIEPLMGKLHEALDKLRTSLGNLTRPV